MLGEADNFRGRLVPRPVPTRTFDGIGDVLEELGHSECPRDPGCRVEDIEKRLSVVVFERRFANDSRLGRQTDRHSSSPSLHTTERFGSGQASGFRVNERLTACATVTAESKVLGDRWVNGVPRRDALP